LSLILVKKTFLIECALIEWVEETGKFSVVLKADIFTTDVNARLTIDKEYQVKYGKDVYKGVLKMIGLKIKNLNLKF